MDSYKLWPNGYWCPEDEDHSDQSDDYIVVGEGTTIGELIEWVGLDKAAVFFQEISE